MGTESTSLGKNAWLQADFLTPQKEGYAPSQENTRQVHVAGAVNSASVLPELPSFSLFSK